MAQRVLVQLITELAQERDITVHALSHGWILLLQKNGRTRRIFGYDFDLNDAVAQMLAKDKSATSLLLQFHNVPAVEHHLFLRPDIQDYVAQQGNWAALHALAEAHDYRLVCKPNHGTSGQDVYRVSSARELEWVMQRLFQEYRAVAVAPYYDIPHEYRVLWCDGEPLLVYEKRRPEVVGDGYSPLGKLVLQAFYQWPLGRETLDEIRALYGDEWNRVLPQGERRPLTWKHNLAAGAYPILDLPPDTRKHLIDLARKAVAVLGLRVAAVDIVYTRAGEWKVLEVNSGVMMEYFSRRHPEGRSIARRVYAHLLDRMFAQDSEQVLEERKRPHRWFFP